MQQLMQRAPGVDKVELPPEYFFLRVTIGSHTTLLELQRIELHPAGRILMWTNPQGEFLRVQEGRLIGAVGLPTEWRAVVLPKLPTWPEIAALNGPYRWVRSRDVMPGYRFGVRDELVVRAIPPPKTSALKAVDPSTLVWFEERFEKPPAGHSLQSGGSSRDAPLPPARYAVRMSTETVMYAEQCLAPDLCIAWQRWSAELQQATGQASQSVKQ